MIDRTFNAVKIILRTINAPSAMRPYCKRSWLFSSDREGVSALADDLLCLDPEEDEDLEALPCCCEPAEVIDETFAICTVIVESSSQSLPFLSTKITPRPASPRDVTTCIPTTWPAERSTTISSNPSSRTGMFLHRWVWIGATRRYQLHETAWCQNQEYLIFATCNIHVRWTHLRFKRTWSLPLEAR